MSKSKKDKSLFSLVSYESGAESNEESGGESDEETNTVEKGSTTGDKESVITDQDHESTMGEKESNGGEDREPGSVGERDVGVIAAASVDRLSVQGDTEVQQDQEATRSSVGPDADGQFSLTIENGFPPGCELIRLPPAPKAQCSQSLQNKIVQVLDRMERYNYSMNEDIRKKKYFKNPSIYEKLIERYEINEYGSNFAENIDDLKAQGYMMYDELDQVQRAEWAKKDKEKKERTKVQMVSAVKKT